MPNKISGPLDIINTGASENLKVRFINKDDNDTFDSSTDPYIEVIDSDTDAGEESNKLKVSADKGLILNADDDTSSIATFQSNDSVKVTIGNTGNIDFAGEINQTSSILFKDDIENVNSNLIKEFLDLVEIKSFRYVGSDQYTISVIIEDEEAKRGKYLKYLLNGDETLQKFDRIPPHLYKYLSVEEINDIFIKIGGEYFAKVQKINLTSLIGLSIGAIKQQALELNKFKDDIAFQNIKISEKNKEYNLQLEDLIEDYIELRYNFFSYRDDTFNTINTLNKRVNDLNKKVDKAGGPKWTLKKWLRNVKKKLQKSKNKKN